MLVISSPQCETQGEEGLSSNILSKAEPNKLLLRYDVMEKVIAVNLDEENTY